MDDFRFIYSVILNLEINFQIEFKKYPSFKSTSKLVPKPCRDRIGRKRENFL